MENELLTPTDIAKIMNVQRPTVYNWRKRTINPLPLSTPSRKHYVIKRSDFEKWLEGKSDLDTKE